MTQRNLVILVLSACTTFDPIERNVCGNGLVEPGEDCDSNDASCVACAVTCKLATDCPNTTYACGVDGLCHAPSGVLAPATAPSLFLVDDLRITDLDHDGIGDVLGVSKTSLEVRFGDAQASLASTFSAVTPPQSGPSAFGDLDGDGTVDTTLVTPDGIVSYTSPYGTASPAVAFLPLMVNGQTLPIRALFPVRGVAIGAIVEDPGTSTLFIEVVSFSNTGTTGETGTFCAVPATDFSPDDLDVYQASGASDPIDLVVSVLTHGATGHHLCATAIHVDAPANDGSRTAHFFDITPPGAAPMRRTVWANLDLDTDPCPSLVNSDGGGAALKAWDGSMSGGHCTLATTAAALPVAPGATASSVAVGRIPLSPTIPFVAADVLVMSSGLYVYNVDLTLPNDVGFTLIYQSERTLNGVAFGDLDGNGSIDAALSAQDDTDLDLVYRAQDGSFPAFVIDRIDTAGVVTTLSIDDYDGNGVGDVAYTEQLIDHEALSVAYGQPGHTRITLPEGVFYTVQSVVPLQVQDSSDPFGVVGDVLILEQLPSGAPALSLLHGSPQRTMLSYFEPRVSNDPLRGQPMRNIVAGNFVSSAGTPQYADLLAFLPSAITTPNNPSASGYLLDGTSDGLDPSDPIDAALGERITGLDDCTGTDAIASGAPCLRTASLMSFPTATDHDIVVGIDHSAPPKAFVIDPWSFTAGGSVPSTIVSSPTTGIPQDAIIHASHAVDLDGDGTPELVLAFAPAETAAAAGAGLVEACAMNATGTPTTCVDLSTPIAAIAPGVSCVDAAPGLVLTSGPTAAPPATPQLIVLCHDATGDSLLARVWWQGGAYQAELVASDLGPLRAIEVGDVTGDGVDDVVAIRGDSGERSVTVLAQCGSRDLTCQATGVAP